MNVLITGASRGLGRAMTRKFIALGHTVAGCGRSADAAAALASDHPRPHQFAAVDTAAADQVDAWARDLAAASFRPDLLINNAAIINRNEKLWRLSAADFDAVVDVNIKGVANVLRAFLPAMVEAESGVIVNFSSGWGRSTSPEVAPYCATKWAIEGLTQALAQELPPGMAAVPLNPGVIATDMLQSCFGDAASDYAGPEAWAETAVPYILSLGPKDNGRPATAP